MNAITDSKQLKQRISELEIRIEEHKEIIGERKKSLIRQFQPANLVRSLWGSIGKAPDLKLKIVSIAATAGVGFLFRNFFARKVKNTGRELLMDIVKMGVTGLVSARTKEKKKLNTLT